MIGYGPESSHFVMELTYNYGVQSYELGMFWKFWCFPCIKLCKTESIIWILGNDFHGITIRSKGIIDRAKEDNYPFILNDKIYSLKSPDGYTFFIVDESSGDNGINFLLLSRLMLWE